MSTPTITRPRPKKVEAQPETQCAYRCPVCWKDVERTTYGYIALHFDSVDLEVCPASREPFTIAEPYVPEVPTHIRRRPHRERPAWHRRRPALRVVA